jgi:outer membrane protein assembly factor BamD
MFKNIIILVLAAFIVFSCSKKNETIKVVAEPTENQMILSVYTDGLEALKQGDAFYAGKKFQEVEALMPQSKWARKASLMYAYSDYSRSSYQNAVFTLERHIDNYPADENIPYVHYLIAMCYYEQILDEKKDLLPLLNAKKKFEFIMRKYPDTDYGIDAKYKVGLIINQLAAKEMSIARFYMKTEKWIPALNRLKIVVEKYDMTIFVEEALHRLVEVYYKLGLEKEANEAASILGYNYRSGDWYAKSYKVFNKKYKAEKIKKEKKEKGLIRKKIKSLFE